jgi:SAM-dependent methyltransferase
MFHRECATPQGVSLLNMISPTDLQRIYAMRFDAEVGYRNQVWQILVREFFQAFIPDTACVLDLGCGYGQFINHVHCSEKYGMDLNPAASAHVNAGVRLLMQDCASPWGLADDSVDVVFSSNFLEHLPHKTAIADTVREMKRCLKPGGRFIAMGPNIRFIKGAYWDFWDHYVPLTERSLSELLLANGFQVERAVPRFLPYTMVGKKRRPIFLLFVYLKMAWLWRFFGRQFLVVARRS